MSEYQYYEFQAIDRRLSEREMQELRSFSTRAQITPTSFINEYHFGSFKGDEDAWMDKYFDVFLYVANWGTHVFMLRLPSTLLSLDAVRQYCPGDPASVREKSDHLIFTFRSDEEPSGDWIDGGGLLDSLIPVRDEIVRGDLRALYLGWLLVIQEGEVDEASLEPPVPDNLGQLSGSLSRLAKFFRLDPDLLAVAAQVSSTTQAPAEVRDDDLYRWLATVSSEEKDRLLVEAMQGRNASLGMELRSRFHRDKLDRGSPKQLPRRTVKELLTAAKSFGERRRREEAHQAAQEKARRDREAALAREKHLESVAIRVNEIWEQVDQLIATRQSKSYDLAVQHLVDLRDVAERKGTQSEFAKRLAKLRQIHVRKPGVINRLNEKGV